MAFRSIGAQDGHILESTEDSGIGFQTHPTRRVMRIGDDNLDRQYRIILSFDTSKLPDTAIITWARLRIQDVDPCCVGWTGFGWEVYEVRTPYFGTSVMLEPDDFQAEASAVLTGQGINVNEYKTRVFGVNELQYINALGYTQIRFRLNIDDDDDMSADYFKVYSGDVPTLKSKPVLFVEYHLP